MFTWKLIIFNLLFSSPFSLQFQGVEKWQVWGENSQALPFSLPQNYSNQIPPKISPVFSHSILYHSCFTLITKLSLKIFLFLTNRSDVSVEAHHIQLIEVIPLQSHYLILLNPPTIFKFKREVLRLQYFYNKSQVVSCYQF